MAARVFTDEQLIEALETMTNAQAAKHFGVWTRTIEVRRAKLARKGWSPEHDMVKTVPDGFHLKGTSTLYDRFGEQKLQWVKTSIDHERQAELMRDAVEALCQDIPRVKPVKAVGEFDEMLAVGYPIGDPHFGEYIWGAEAGGDWDLAIAKQMHIDAMSALVGHTPRAEQAVIVNLGDAMHYDSLMPKTPRSGHILNADGRYPKMIDVLIETLAVMIDLALTRHKKVHVINVQGNHDEAGAHWLPRVLSARYLNEPRVTFDMSPRLFNYFRFKKVLVGSHHGHSAKMQALPGIMAADMPQDWGETLHRYWWTGHVHHESVKEFPGVLCESFNTLAPADPYAFNAGYRSRQTMKAIVLHGEHGEVGRHMVNPYMLKGAAA